MTFFLGIDGGGTKTACAVGDENGAVLGIGVSAGSNMLRVGQDNARASLQTAIIGACRKAGIEPAQIEHSCVGMAGTSLPHVRDFIGAAMREIVRGETAVVTDQQIALEAAFPGQPGVIVEAGTGSFAYGRNQRGETARAGGWGFAISDEGSGHWIGRAAVKASFRAHDEKRRTVLLDSILRTWQIGTMEDLIRVANGTPPPNFAALVPPVMNCAEDGDELAEGLLRSAGNELSDLAAVVIRRLWPEPQPIPVALLGGVFQNSMLVRKSFSTGLRSLRHETKVDLCGTEPVVGALALARSQA